MNSATKNAPKNAAKNTPKNAKLKALTKNQLKAKIAEESGLSLKQVGGVLDSLAGTALAQLQSKVGQFTIPGLVKLRKVHKAATKEKQMKSPFSGEMITVKAKPARNVVRARVLKAVKDAVAS